MSVINRNAKNVNKLSSSFGIFPYLFRVNPHVSVCPGQIPDIGGYVNFSP